MTKPDIHLTAKKFRKYLEENTDAFKDPVAAGKEIEKDFTELKKEYLDDYILDLLGQIHRKEEIDPVLDCEIRDYMYSRMSIKDLRVIFKGIVNL